MQAAGRAARRRISFMGGKEIAGRAAAMFVEDGMRVGLGTGSTVRHTILALGERLKAGLRFTGVPTSLATQALAKSLGIPLEELTAPSQLDIAIDGADEVDGALCLVKGGGGALLREKLVASAARRYIVVIDEGKLVAQLGRRPIPVEVIPFGFRATQARISALGAESALRMLDGRTFVTDNGNYVLDCVFSAPFDAGELHTRLKLLPGVVETGIFADFADLVLVGGESGDLRELGRP